MSSLIAFWNILKSSSYLKEMLENLRNLLRDDIDYKQKKMKKKRISRNKSRGNKSLPSNVHHLYQNSKIHFLNYSHHHPPKINKYNSKIKNIETTKLEKEAREIDDPKKEVKMGKEINKYEENQLTAYKSFSKPKNKNQMKKTKKLTKKIILLNIILFLIKVKIV